MPERYLTRETPGVVILNDTLLTDAPYTYLDQPGDLAWKLDVGAECNEALHLAEELERTGSSAYRDGLTNAQMAAILRSLVERVATFEELQCAP